MSAKLIKIRTIIDFFLLNSNLSRELLIKRINKLIKIHNTQVKQGRFHEDAMEYISTAEQLIFLKNTKKRDRKSTRLNSSHANESRMPSSA